MGKNPFSDIEVVSTYTRAQAIEDGVLADVTEAAARHGFKVPVAIASEAWNRVTAVDESVDPDDRPSIPLQVAGVLYSTMQTVKASINDPSKSLRLGHGGQRVEYDYLGTTLFAESGPGDNGEQVITIMALLDL